MAFRKPIHTGLSALAGGVFALGMSIPAPTIGVLFNTGPTFHILTASAPLRAEADPNSKTKGLLKQGSCILWIQSAGDNARILLQTSTKIKEVWMDAALLRPAPQEMGRDSCKAHLMPRPN